MKKELELSKKIERRLEIIHAHTKRGNTIQEVIKEFGVCRDTYYHWYHKYVEKGIFGLFDSKRGPKTPPNKTSDDLASKVIETAGCSSGHKPSVSTVQWILQSNGMNRQKGRRSKKRWKKRGQ